MHLIPGLGVDATSAGGSTRLALAYYTVSGGALQVGFVSSSNGGATWTRQQRLSAQPIALEWLPDTTAGLMVGDYISTSFVGGRAVPVVAIASARGAQRNQAMFAAVLPVP
jgi:hypothetical protein